MHLDETVKFLSLVFGFWILKRQQKMISTDLGVLNFTDVKKFKVQSQNFGRQKCENFARFARNCAIFERWSLSISG